LAHAGAVKVEIAAFVKITGQSSTSFQITMEIVMEVIYKMG
jgi:hypothetical protein